MLEPDSRRLLRELLRPPAGFHFDRAIGTTFSLDLMALLTMPVAFTMFDRSSSNGHNPDPLALIQAIRQYAGRMHIFCQAGQIAVPKRHHLLFAHLEDSVVEVTPPRDRGVFHPKLTVLRFVEDTSSLPDDHPDNQAYEPAVRYRLLCGSRNLTFDRSWDTMLVLEGDLASHRKRGFSRNRRLGEFVGALPGLAIRDIARDVPEACRQVADELRRVDFEPPEGFEDYGFWPLGLDEGSNWPFPEDMHRLLVVSPFLSDNPLGQLETSRQKPILVSRRDALDELSAETTDRFETYLLHPAAEEPRGQSESEENEETDAPPQLDTEGDREAAEDLTGLHAKIYVVDCGKETHIFTGSANATAAAFSRNIEFLVELRGPRRLFGVNNMVRPEHNRGEDETKAVHFDDLLETYHRPSEPVVTDPDAREAERLADRARRQIAQAGLVIEVEPLESRDSENQYRLVIRQGSRKTGAILTDGVSIHCRPIRLTHQAAPLDHAFGKTGAVFEPASFEAISAFVVFEVEVRKGKAIHKTSFVLNLPLRGAPEDRNERLLTALLASREQLLRYLLMLLAEDEHDLRAMTEAIEILDPDRNGDQADPRTELGLPLLEPILRALEHQPERLDQVARLVEDLSRHEQGRALLPDGFADLWRTIWEARKEVSR